ncbi:hypothetical protein [Saccharicrinis fermentans]|uniref:VOC domain-containing protein n=1 Tax=Saccharicrinis fermentans DSM 9555 = JCM 21142 TaxID=869213 RepID=W7Y1R4_9BACT|nr:hypothetical protein [Saccharicrinis fermentans]GAF01458.1 hypothetical protein JCM21142_65 [Saccharicrinis fermentans DSM 9555 = JCM 21142]
MQTLISSPSTNQATSLDFYKRLNFYTLSEYPAIISDGKFLIEINTDKYARTGIKIINKSWENEINYLSERYPSFPIKDGYLIRDNNGVWIYLIESKELEITFNTHQSRSYLGNFMGISVETTSFEHSISFWNTLGFVQVSGAAEQGWIVLANSDGFAVSLMLPLSCPHTFTNPSMTFFNNGKNLENISKIRQSNIPIKEEITAFNPQGIADNIIIQDPGGYNIFVFND